MDAVRDAGKWRVKGRKRKGVEIEGKRHERQITAAGLGFGGGR